MREFLCGAECDYECNFDHAGGRTALFLHGWGGDIRSFAAAYGTMTDMGVNAVNFAFPRSVPPDWGIYEYATQVKEFLRRKGVIKPIIVGHSFGGRVGIILAAQGLCERLVLVDSAGMRPRKSIVKKIRIARYHYRVKHGKPLDGMGSVDYNSIDKAMRPVFVRVVNTHLEKLLPSITCKTLIVWGRRDRDTPPYMARRLKRGIAHSELIMLDGGHFCYATEHYAFIKILKNFISEQV